jgi:formate C-acetyltransferase
VRIWNKTPEAFIIKAARLARTGIGLPAFYNDEVIIPSLMSRGVSLADARTYNIIGCVEPQKAGKTDGWHDAAFFNMCRPLEMVFSNGYEFGEKVGLQTGDVTAMETFEEFYEAYEKQMRYFIAVMVNALNCIDTAHATRMPLPFQSSMIDDCIGRGKSLQEGGAIYNLTGPQGFGIANVADSMLAIRELVYDKKLVTMAEMKDALDNNFGRGLSTMRMQELSGQIVSSLMASGQSVGENEVKVIAETIAGQKPDAAALKRYDEILALIAKAPKYGNDDDEADMMARRVSYTYTKPLEHYRNPRGGIFQAGLYPVSANVPLGRQTGATPDGRLANTPVADGVGPMQGRDIKGPTATANSVAKLDHGIASNGTLFNQKFHPSALAGEEGLQKFSSYIRTFFDEKGMHMQFNVVSRETLLDAQQHPENYKSLVVRVAGYSALFTTLSKALQDDIIKRTEQQGGF